MNILIVGPLFNEKGWGQKFRQVTGGVAGRAACLDQALECLEHYDGVICANCIPTHSGSALEPIETQKGNWAAVSNRCRELSKPFALVASPGHYLLAERFNEVASKTLEEWPAFAFVAPVDLAVVAEAVAIGVRFSRQTVGRGR